MLEGRYAPLTVADAITTGHDLLSASNVPEPRLEAAILLCHALGGRSHAWLLSHGDTPVRYVDNACFLATVARRVRREPSACLVGLKHWFDITLIVDRNVLIPRPETERLAEIAITIARGKFKSTGRPPSALDVGTGSGALAIAIARSVPGIQVIAIESSAGALRTARINAARLGTESIRFVQGHLLAPMTERIDVIVANLPYVRSAEIPDLEPELAFEPREALDGGDDGLDVIRAFLIDARAHAASEGVLLLEHGIGQGEAIAAYARLHLADVEILFHKDLTGRDRFVQINLPK